ncbi:MAG: glycoside hydrolase family 3 N-terminal domain-containing protein [Pseudomonadota bacterium]
MNEISHAHSTPPDGASAVIFGCSGVALTADEAAFFRETRPWGFILFARNIGDPDEIRALTAALREAAGWAAPVLIDQEGGRVARLRGPIWRDWPPVGWWCAAADAGLISEDALLEALRLRYALTGRELAALGVDVDCAPLMDLRLPGKHEVMGDRALGATPERVGPRAAAIAAGLRAAGVLPVIKHMPGHGRSAVDSHHDLPQVEEPLETLDSTDFAAFGALKAETLGMTAHVVYAALDPERPATLSPVVIDQIIRKRIGFDGLLMTDDLCMNAISGPVDGRLRDSVAAGCDLALHCIGDMDEMKAAQPGLTPLSADGRRRSAAALAGRGAGEALDEAAAEARLRELVGWTRDEPGRLGAEL